MLLAKALVEARQRGITVIFITHRSGFIKISNKMLYLQDGVIKAFGPTEEILAKMRDLMQSQQSGEQAGKQEVRQEARQEDKHEANPEGKHDSNS